jgi:multidrug transporter EmrE-like cation transporter
MKCEKLMVDYALGVLFGILAGLLNFLGQVLQKKAINDTAPDRRKKGLVKSLVRNKTWLLGIICMVAFSSIFLLIAQAIVGAALIPGLGASGFIILAIGSVFILKESLKIFEILAIILLMIAITLIGFSQLAITGSLTYFSDAAFDMRLALFSILFTALWLGLFYFGRKAKKHGTILLALGTGFPFVVGNIWLQPMIVSLTVVLGGMAGIFGWEIFLISVAITILANLIGLGHYQYALNAGNASIVVPVQQIPQQIAPIIIYFLIYQFVSPFPYSLYFLVVGTVLICFAGFMLGKRQASLEQLRT